MSQHSYKYNEINILAGWDRPLKSIFMVIKNDTSDIPVYSNLDDPSTYNLKDSAYYQEVLKTLSIPAPDGFWSAIEDDRDKNKGNAYKKWELN